MTLPASCPVSTPSKGSWPLFNFSTKHLAYLGKKKKKKKKSNDATSSFLKKKKRKKINCGFKEESQRTGRESSHSCITVPCLPLLEFTSLNADKEG